MAQFSAESAEAQWISQLTIMRAALSDLKLPLQKNLQGESYVGDQEFDEDNVTFGDTGDDVWDFISDTEEDYYSSDNLVDAVDPTGATDEYNSQWLKNKCITFAGRRQGLSAEELEGQIMTLLSSNTIDEELQSALTDIIGFHDLDFVIELILHRGELVSFPTSSKKTANSVIGRLQTKQQREEALRQMDFEHKNAPLGPSLHRDDSNYPHIYRAHFAGNILSANGQKYALPSGSEGKSYEVGTIDVN
jgi:antiviral helicase SLH1